MSDHVDPAVLVALAEGRLSGAEAATAQAGVAACAHCAGHFEDLRMLAGVMARAEGASACGSGDREILPPALDRAFEDVIRSQIRPPAARKRMWFGLAAAAAAVVIVSLLVFEDGIPAERRLLRGAAVYEPARGGRRSDARETLHFEVELEQRLHLAIFRVSGTSVDVVYPDPNPTLGTYGRTTPFEPGEHVRIPPTPLADLPASRTASRPLFFAAASRTPPAATVLAAALDAARSAAPEGADAVRAALAQRFEAVVPLDVR